MLALQRDIHKSQRVVVTGAGSGIGRATVHALAQKGASLALLERDEDALRRTTEEVRSAGGDALATVLDVSQEEQVIEAFASIDAEWDAIDAVVHVAGIMRGQRADIRNIDIGLWNEVLAVNLTGAFLVAKCAAARMIPQRSGVIVLVGSGAGVIGPSGSIPYGASKGGVQGLALTLAEHLAPYSIRVHNLCPGSIDTPLLRGSLEEGVSNGAPAEYLASANEHLGEARGVGEIIALLTSNEAAYLRGTVFTR